MIQKKNHTYSLGEEVCILWTATQGYLDDIAVDKVLEFEQKLLDELTTSKGKEIIKKINSSKELTTDTETNLKKLVSNLIKN